ncbi:MAG: hypothetical protein A2046_06045 [Bacteroidetes bacterium GWA2_30_7]|nr:MAG: hypothetical protein A2046_06045 [Bacteroidetes bacterium GWA2_30_7]
MIKVLIVEDHKILRDGLKAALSGNKEIKVIGECEDGNQVMDFLEKNPIDVILMDIKMPIMNGIDATQQVIEKYPNMKILVLSMHNEEAYITKIFKAGASGYILKNTSISEMIDGIKKVHSGEIFYSLEVANIMVSKYMNKTIKAKSKNFTVTIDDLTKREREIIKLISNEFTNQEIADKLFISARTVDTHRRNLLQKLGVKNTAGLVKFAMVNEML